MMPAKQLLDARTTALIIIDPQEAFRPVIDGFDAVIARTAILVKGAALLGLPILITEQVPQKLGKTVTEVRSTLPPGVTTREKTAFSCCGADSFVNELKALRAVQQVILCGIETHVCVNQSAHDLMLLEYQVHLPLDCTSSRKPVDREAGLQKMLQSGVIPGSSEMALFELMRDARHEQFKAISKLMK